MNFDDILPVLEKLIETKINFDLLIVQIKGRTAARFTFEGEVRQESVIWYHVPQLFIDLWSREENAILARKRFILRWAIGYMKLGHLFLSLHLKINFNPNLQETVNEWNAAFQSADVKMEVIILSPDSSVADKFNYLLAHSGNTQKGVIPIYYGSYTKGQKEINEELPLTDSTRILLSAIRAGASLESMCAAFDLGLLKGFAQVTVE